MKVESEEESCNSTRGIHIICSQVQERGNYLPSLKEAGDPGVDGRIILRRIFGRWDGGA
jgi:hypothetical protein